MDQQTVIRLRHVNVYHADDPFGSCSPRKLMQRGELVLSDLDLEVREGEFVYLIGRVGSGKSSLLKILYADLQLVSRFHPVAFIT